MPTWSDACVCTAQSSSITFLTKCFGTSIKIFVPKQKKHLKISDVFLFALLFGSG